MRVAFYNAPVFTESALRYRLNPPLAPAMRAADIERWRLRLLEVTL